VAIGGDVLQTLYRPVMLLALYQVRYQLTCHAEEGCELGSEFAARVVCQYRSHGGGNWMGERSGEGRG
jgi:hypothetical protein